MVRHPMVSALVLSFLPALALPAAAALFTERSETPVGAPLGLSAGDLDRDGDLDLVVNQDFASVIVLLNDGSGRFAQPPGSVIRSVPSPSVPVIGSFNPRKDKIPDLVVVSSDWPSPNRAFLLNGDGSGRFELQTFFAIGGVSGAICRLAAVSDFNGDGNDDVVFNTGDVRFGSGSTLIEGPHVPVLLEAFDVVAGDFDGDGHPDVVFNHNLFHGTLQLFLSVPDTGDFVEAPGSPLRFGDYPETMSAADFDEDGDLDLAVTDISLRGVHVLLNQGGGRLVPSGFVPVPAQYPRGLATADLDGDGHADLAVGSGNSGDSYGNAISLLLGDGAGGFTRIDESPRVAGAGPQSIVSADLNWDGAPDLATIDSWTGVVAVFLHTPPPFMEVAIDVLPGSDDNVIRLGSQGSLPVAILSTEGFDATTVAPESVRLAGAPVNRNGQEEPACSSEDVDRDHRADLLCKVDKAALQLNVEDTVAVLNATTFGGIALRGQDTVRVLGGKAPRLPSTTRWPAEVSPGP